MHRTVLFRSTGAFPSGELLCESFAIALLRPPTDPVHQVFAVAAEQIRKNDLVQFHRNLTKRLFRQPGRTRSLPEFLYQQIDREQR